MAGSHWWSGLEYGYSFLRQSDIVVVEDLNLRFA